jgi:hypothetical protein
MADGGGAINPWMGGGPPPQPGRWEYSGQTYQCCGPACQGCPGCDEVTAQVADDGPAWITDIHLAGDRMRAAVAEANTRRARVELGLGDGGKLLLQQQMEMDYRVAMLAHAQQAEAKLQAVREVRALAVEELTLERDQLAHWFRAQQRRAFARRARLKQRLRGFVFNYLCW